MPDLPSPTHDGLYIPTVGEWSRDKHYFLGRYIDIFTSAMKSKWQLHYIDLFAGAGIEMLEHNQELCWGSPLIAAQSPKPFDKLHLCELDRQKYNSLEQRIKRIRPDSQTLCADANEKIHEIVKDIPSRSLSLAFLDPYSLQLDFTTLRALAAKRADLIIFFPDRLDILRNWKKYYYADTNSKLDRYLGQDGNWRAVLDNAPPENRVELLRNLYIDQLREKLVYQHFEFERIYTKGRPLYYLVFCSRHNLGAEFWRKITRKKRNGQRTFDFDKS